MMNGLKNKRQNKLSLMLRLMFFGILLQSVCLFTNSKSRVIELPESFGIGFHKFSDDWKSFDIMEKLSQYTGNRYDDSINTLCLIKICNVSDGALAEIMGIYCIADFSNKPNSFISIYKSETHPDIKWYIDFMACELAFNKLAHYTPGTFEALEESLLQQRETIRDYETFKEILQVIQERYLYYVTYLAE